MEWQQSTQRQGKVDSKIAFVLGNGKSRLQVDHTKLVENGTVYGCNALYREFSPDYLVAVDPRMVAEIARTNYQLTNLVYTNRSRSYDNIEGLNFLEPMRGWSSGPSAIWLAAQHKHKEIYLIGFDFAGINGKVNNVYANTQNYKRDTEEEIFYKNWVKQIQIIFREYPKTKFLRVGTSESYEPIEFKNFRNIHHYDVTKFVNFLDQKTTV